MFRKNRHTDDNDDLVRENLTETFLNALSMRIGRDNTFFYSLYTSMPKEYRPGFIHDMRMLNSLLDDKILMACPMTAENIR